MSDRGTESTPHGSLVAESFRAFARWACNRLRPFHYGSVARDVPRPLGLWISNGTDMGVLGKDRSRPYLNVTLFGRFRGRIYAKELR